VYSTCTFCHSTLGGNEMLEAFPVGRRLAFDAAKGRLWVVCPTCRQWNLSPLDERWEAIEAAERLYRDTKLRAATEQVGLARMRDGSELIRIGAPLRPEFAAWRYGERFTTRWRRYTALSVVFGGGALLVSPLAGLGFSMLPYYGVGIVKRAIDKRRVIARASDEKGGVAFTLADARLELRRGDVLRGVAPQSGGAPFGNGAGDFDPQTGNLKLGVPVAAFIVHGASDTAVRLAEGQKSLAYWRLANKSATGQTATAPSPCQRQNGGTKPVVFCTIPGMGHTIWTGAPAAIWQFFQEN